MRSAVIGAEEQDEAYQREVMYSWVDADAGGGEVAHKVVDHNLELDEIGVCTEEIVYVAPGPYSGSAEVATEGGCQRLNDGGSTNAKERGHVNR